MPKELFKALKKARVMGQALNISSAGKPRPDQSADKPSTRPKEGFKDRGKSKKFAKAEKPTKARVKKRARDDKDKGKPKRAKKKDS
jgi:hypothetical protein